MLGHRTCNTIFEVKLKQKKYTILKLEDSQKTDLKKN